MSYNYYVVVPTLGTLYHCAIRTELCPCKNTLHDYTLICAYINESINLVIKSFLHQLMSQSFCTETQPKTPNSKQWVSRKNSLKRLEPRKKLREEPGYEGWPVLFWLCRVEIITEHGQDVQMFIDDQQGQIFIHSSAYVFICTVKMSTFGPIFQHFGFEIKCFL